MLKKKLLTLAAVLGILSMGACFLPEPRDGPSVRPPAPPELLALNGIHSIFVVIENNSVSNHIDSAAYAKIFTEEFNSPTKVQDYQQVWATTDEGTTDAKLLIKVLTEEANHPEQKTGSKYFHWHYSLRYSAILSSKDGKIIWEKPGVVHIDTFTSYDVASSQTAPEPWSGQSDTEMMRRSGFQLIRQLFLGQK
jgi:hypothetical protein